MAGIGRMISRIFLWTYERGSWQYDAAVILIVAFVLLTPGSWFRDQPDVGDPAAASHVRLVTDAAGEQTYRVDARVLAPPERTPQLQNQLHGALQKTLPDLRGGRFEISKIDAVRDDEGTVIAYEVTIRRK